MNSIKPKNLSFLGLQALLLAATLFVTSFCIGRSITESNEPDQRLLHQIRLSLYNNQVNERNNAQYPSIEIVEKPPKGTRYGNCHNYAISTLLGLKGKLPEDIPLCEGSDWYNQFNFLRDYCQEVSTPQDGDLVIYQYDDILTVEHTGIYREDGTVESKWGGERRIYKGPAFHIPYDYGNSIKYYRINQPVDEIIKDMKKKVSQSDYTQKKCAKLNRLVAHQAEQSDNREVWRGLEYCMCIDVNTTNDNNETLLMIAKKNNNDALVKMLLKYKAKETA